MLGGYLRGSLAVSSIALVCVLVLSGCATVRTIRERPRDPESLLRYLNEDLQFVFTRIESDLDGTGRMLERTGPSGGAARELLEGLTLRHPAIATAFTASVDGAIVASEPIPHRTPESQPTDFESRIMSALDGAPGLHGSSGDRFATHVLWRPIPAFRSYDESRVGALVSLPATFDLIRSAPRIWEPVDIWMMDPDGVIVADLDGAEVGRNLFSDSAYAPHAEMLNVVRMVAERPNGRAVYTYFGRDFIVVKEAGWNTVRLGGREWRLVVEHVVEGDPELVSRIAQPFRPMTYSGLIERIAQDPRLVRAAADARPSQVLTVLQDYYERFPGLYNLQWMDSAGVTQTGYPTGRSLRAYDHRTGLKPGDDWMLSMLDSGAAHVQSGRLALGYEGNMYLAPVPSGGMVYGVQRTGM